MQKISSLVVTAAAAAVTALSACSTQAPSLAADAGSQTSSSRTQQPTPGGPPAQTSPNAPGATPTPHLAPPDTRPAPSRVVPGNGTEPAELSQGRHRLLPGNGLPAPVTFVAGTRGATFVLNPVPVTDNCDRYDNTLHVWASGPRTPDQVASFDIETWGAPIDAGNTEVNVDNWDPQQAEPSYLTRQPGFRQTAPITIGMRGEGETALRMTLTYKDGSVDTAVARFGRETGLEGPRVTTTITELGSATNKPDPLTVDFSAPGCRGTSRGTTASPVLA